MAIELAGIKLTKVHKVSTLERASFVYKKIAGLDGQLSQDLGRDSSRLQIEGIFYGEKAKDDLYKLREKYLKREAVDFLADITGQSYVSEVLIELFEVMESAHEPNQFSFALILVEHTEPKNSMASDMAKVDQAIKLDAKLNIDLLELPDSILLGAIPELTNPVEPVKSALEPIKEATAELLKSTEGLKKLLG